jgi:hypothetical protein
VITRRRKRPRVRSVSFKTLGWLIRREASFLVAHHPYGSLPLTFERRAWLRLDTPDCERTALAYTKRFPRRRYFP